MPSSRFFPVVVLTVSLSAPVLGQTTGPGIDPARPSPDNPAPSAPPVSPTPSVPRPDGDAARPLAPPEIVPPEARGSVSGASGADGTLSDHLSTTGGVIHPPPSADGEIIVAPPPTGPNSTPVIPPPGSPQNPSALVPK